MSDITWLDDLPADAIMGGTKVTQWGVTARQLKAKPKVWATVGGLKPSKAGATALMNDIRLGRKHKEFEPEGSFEAAYQDRGDGTFQVIARFVGDDSAFANAPADTGEVTDEAAGYDPDPDDATE